MSKSAKTTGIVIAAAKDDDTFRAVALRKQSGKVELLWGKRMAVDSGTWSDFAAQCNLSANRMNASVVGLDSAAVVFYKISTPHVNKEETAAIVRMQAESLLPLPQDQIEVAWRTMPSTNGSVDVTIAAARRDLVRRFADEVRPFAPNNILPACEGTAAAWRGVFSQRGQQALVLSIGQHSTQVFLVDDGVLATAAVLDGGMSNLASAGDFALDRFAHDARILAESLGWKENGDCPVFVMSDGSENLDHIASRLNEAGLDATVSLPEAEALHLPNEFDVTDVYEYRVPLGLALMKLDAPAHGLDLLENITETQKQEKAKSARLMTALAAAVVGVMLVVLLGAAYFIDVKTNARLTALINEPSFQQAKAHQTLLQNIARQRPDMLAFLTDLSAGENKGIILDEFHFKKGQLASVTGRADNEERMWEYQANLLSQDSLKDVLISSQSPDSKTKKIAFTMVFHYKKFTAKTAAF